MHRREFLKISALGLALNPVQTLWAGALEPTPLDRGVKDRLMKSRFFQQTYEDDIILPRDQHRVLKSCLGRLNRIQRYVGYGNFALLDFDQACYLARNYKDIQRFSKSELEFLEMIFYNRADTYGFMGEKPIDKMTEKIRKKSIRKIPRTGNYLYRGRPEQVYAAIQRQVGDQVVLTSGVRGVMKQFLLFLNKVVRSDGNLSMASRSLAPPGYSFHGIGDFDVGKKGYGIHNFTERFTETKVYKKLEALGYIRFRYERDNQLGVRFEPWHIEVG